MHRLDVDQRGDFEVCIRRGADGVLGVTDAAGTALVYLRRVGDRVFVRAARSATDAVLNEETLSRRDWTELGPADVLSVAGTPIEMDTSMFRGRPRYSLVARNLEYRLKRGRVLLQQTDVCIRRKRLTAILGPAGCGKSTLLKCLNGYLTPTKGAVTLVRRDGPNYDVHKTPAAVQDLMGYVPQKEVMLPDLTVRYSLNCRLALRYPDMTQEMRARIIARTLQQLGFRPGKPMETYLSTRIADLSGGEKRRANIAHELVLQPLVLLLDEPTSGLASTDAETIVCCLKSLCEQQGVAVAAVVHQPSRDTFALFDDVILMNAHGRVVYHGPAAEAETVLRHHAGGTADDAEQVNPAEYLLENVNHPSVRGLVGVQQFKATYRAVFDELSGGSREESPKRRSSSLLHQAWLLLGRSLRVFRKDRFTLVAALGQVPLIAALMIIAFSRYPSDHKEWDAYSRYVTHAQTEYDALFKQDAEPRNWEDLHNEALGEARNEDNLPPPQRRISTPHAGKRSGVYFMLVAAAIWFGIMGASKEIVCDAPLLRREVRTGVSLSAWLAAKLLSQTIIAGLQCGLLVVVTVPFLLGGGGLTVLRVWLLTWMTGVSAVCVGLFISACSPSYRVALTLVPLIMIPQFLFGGFLRAEDRMGSAGRLMSYATVQRWGFVRLCRSDPYAERGVLKSEAQPREVKALTREQAMTTHQYRLVFHAPFGAHKKDERHPLFDMVRFRETGLIALHLGPEARASSVRDTTLALAAICALSLFACGIAVRQRV